MPVSAIATVSSELNASLLDGFTPQEVRTILSAATQRRFAAGSVPLNQGHPANQLFLLTKGRAQALLRHRGRQKTSNEVAWAGRSFRRAHNSFESVHVSHQHRNRNG